MKKEVVIITGAAQGIGAGIAKVYAQAGSTVIIADVNEQLGTQFAESIGAYFIQTDVRVERDIIQLFKETSKRFGEINILINNAGKTFFIDPLELTLEQWDDMMHTNLRSVFLCSREAAKYMKNGGAIVSMASTRAFMSEPHSEAYAATKGGIVALTHALAASLAPRNITVNCISPGWIETSNYDQLSEKDHQQHFSGRVGKPTDIAKACFYLTDSSNNFITGQNITIDGGMTKKMIYEE